MLGLLEDQVPARYASWVDQATMRSLVTQARVGRLATVRPDGRPHAVPTCFALVAETVYSAVDDKPKRSRRLRRTVNILATGVACLLVDRYDEDWMALWWVRLDGAGRIADDPAEVAEAMAALSSKYEQYARRPPAGPILAIDIERWSGWAARPFS